MKNNYEKYALIFKVLSDETRLKIVSMLSDKELCACKILEAFSITQPTLSYHIKILTDCGLVNARKEGSWIRYNNNNDLIFEVKLFWDKITSEQDNCICKDISEDKKCE